MEYHTFDSFVQVVDDIEQLQLIDLLLLFKPLLFPGLIQEYQNALSSILQSCLKAAEDQNIIKMEYLVLSMLNNNIKNKFLYQSVFRLQFSHFFKELFFQVTDYSQPLPQYTEYFS